MKNSKISVCISPYGNINAGNRDKLQARLDEEGIMNMPARVDVWRDFGGFEPRGRSLTDNAEMFAKCSLCVTLIDGEIFCCPRAGNGAALGLVPKPREEYVPVYGRSISDIKKDLAVFSKLLVISTCDFCDNPGPEIPIAEQE